MCEGIIEEAQEGDNEPSMEGLNPILNSNIIETKSYVIIPHDFGLLSFYCKFSTLIEFFRKWIYKTQTHDFFNFLKPLY